MKIRVTAVMEFEPAPEAYDDFTPAAVAEVERANYQSDPWALATDMSDLGFTVTVEHVEK